MIIAVRQCHMHSDQVSLWNKVTGYTGLGVWNSTDSHPIGNCCHQQWRDKRHLPQMRGTVKRMATNRMESLKRPEWQSGAIPKPASEWLQPGQVGRRTWPRQSWQTGWPGPAWSKEFSCQLLNKIVCKFATPRVYHLLDHQWTWESVAYWKPDPGEDGQPACRKTYVYLT